jgi:hypothetical protein
MFGVLKSRAVPLGAIVFCPLLPRLASAGPVACNHVTDGTFTTPLEWAACPTAVSQNFAQAGAAGGSLLYVDQGIPGDNTLYLMYDYYAGTANPPGSIFDVFFEVVPRGDAYLVHIPDTGSLTA